MRLYRPLGQDAASGQDLQQRQAQNIAHQQLRSAHGYGVEGESGGEGGGKARLVPDVLKENHLFIYPEFYIPELKYRADVAIVQMDLSADGLLSQRVSDIAAIVEGEDCRIHSPRKSLSTRSF